MPGWQPVLNWQNPPVPGPCEAQNPPCAVQSVQTDPPAPHSVDWSPVTQRSPSQQPAQFCGPQLVCASHTPPPPPSAKHVPFSA